MKLSSDGTVGALPHKVEAATSTEKSGGTPVGVPPVTSVFTYEFTHENRKNGFHRSVARRIICECTFLYDGTVKLSNRGTVGA